MRNHMAPYLPITTLKRYKDMLSHLAARIFNIDELGKKLFTLSHAHKMIMTQQSWLTSIVWPRTTTTHVTATTNTTTGVKRWVRATTNLQHNAKNKNKWDSAIISSQDPLCYSWMRLGAYICSTWHVITAITGWIHPSNITTTKRTW